MATAEPVSGLYSQHVKTLYMGFFLLAASATEYDRTGGRDNFESVRFGESGA